MRYRLQRHDGTDCSATMVPFTVLRMVPIQRYRQYSCFTTVFVEYGVFELGWLFCGRYNVIRNAFWNCFIMHGIHNSRFYWHILCV